MSLARGQILQKMWLYMYFIGCVWFAWYCGKMYSRRLFSYGEIVKVFQGFDNETLNCEGKL